MYLDHYANLNKEILTDFKHVVYRKEVQCILYKWQNSFGYALRKFYKSVSRILTCEGGMGSEYAGIYGIEHFKRANLCIEDNELIGGRWLVTTSNETGSKSNNNKKRREVEFTEVVMILPRLELVGCEWLKETGVLTKDGQECLERLQEYALHNNDYNFIIDKMTSAFDEADEDGKLTFQDNYTPSCFERMSIMKHSPKEFIKSVNLLHILINAIGVGSFTESELPLKPSRMLAHLVSNSSKISEYSTIVCLKQIEVADPHTGIYSKLYKIKFNKIFNI